MVHLSIKDSFCPTLLLGEVGEDEHPSIEQSLVEQYQLHQQGFAWFEAEETSLLTSEFIHSFKGSFALFDSLDDHSFFHNPIHGSYDLAEDWMVSMMKFFMMEKPQAVIDESLKYAIYFLKVLKDQERSNLIQDVSLLEFYELLIGTERSKEWMTQFLKNEEDGWLSKTDRCKIFDRLMQSYYSQPELMQPVIEGLEQVIHHPKLFSRLIQNVNQRPVLNMLEALTTNQSLMIRTHSNQLGTLGRLVDRWMVFSFQAALESAYLNEEKNSFPYGWFLSDAQYFLYPDIAPHLRMLQGYPHLCFISLKSFEALKEALPLNEQHILMFLKEQLNANLLLRGICHLDDIKRYTSLFQASASILPKPKGVLSSLLHKWFHYEPSELQVEQVKDYLKQGCHIGQVNESQGTTFVCLKPFFR